MLSGIQSLSRSRKVAPQSLSCLACHRAHRAQEGLTGTAHVSDTCLSRRCPTGCDYTACAPAPDTQYQSLQGSRLHSACRTAVLLLMLFRVSRLFASAACLILSRCSRREQMSSLLHASTVALISRHDSKKRQVLRLPHQ